MATTYELKNMPLTTPTDVAVYFLDQSKLVQLETDPNVKLPAGTVEQRYALNDGALGDKTVVSVRSLMTKSGFIRNSVMLETENVTLVDGVETARTPVTVTVAWSHEGTVTDASALMRMIGTAYSLTFNGVVTKVPQTGLLTKLSRRIVAIFG